MGPSRPVVPAALQSPGGLRTRMSLLRIILRALSGNLRREMDRLGVVRADQVRVGWVIRTPGQGRGRRWWVRGVSGPTGQQGLIRLSVQLVEVHGVRSRERIRAMGHDPDRVDDIHIEDTALVVIEYLDWADDEGEQTP